MAALSTKHIQALAHSRIIEVGEAIRSEYEEEFERDKTRALVATEEIVRREERLICESKLQDAREQWMLEKEQLLEEARMHELNEISREKDLLEKRLQQQFEASTLEIEQLHQKNMKEKLEEARENAEKEKKEAIALVREEERIIAEGIVTDLHKEFQETQRQETLKHKEETRKILQEQMERLQKQHDKEKDQLENKLNEEYKERLSEVMREHQSETLRAQQVYYDLLLESQKTLDNFRDAMNDKEYWERKYEDLKLEFADFINQFPGFKADFILK